MIVWVEILKFRKKIINSFKFNNEISKKYPMHFKNMQFRQIFNLTAKYTSDFNDNLGRNF